MNHSDKFNSIKHIRPNAVFALRGDEVEWLDKVQIEPTEVEIENGLIAYQADKLAEAEAKATARQALLDKLGITADEAKLLLGGN